MELEIHLSGSLTDRSSGAASRETLAKALQSINGDSAVAVTLVTGDGDVCSASLQAVCGQLQTWSSLQRVRIRLGKVVDQQGSDTISEVRQVCATRGIEVGVDMVITAAAENNVYAPGESAVFKSYCDRSDELLQSGTAVRWLVPLVRGIAFRLQRISLCAQMAGAELVLVPSEFVGDEDSADAEMTPDERLFVWDFITYQILESGADSLLPAMRDYYTALAAAFVSGQLDTVSSSVNQLVVADSDGWVVGRREILAAAPRAAAMIGDAIESGPAPAESIAFQVSEMTDVLSVGLRGHSRAIRVRAGESIGPQPVPSQRFPKVLLIGAYGGEHIGDIAILGGVLFRMHEQFGTQQAVLLTQRLAHTRHLTPMLDTPVELDVDVYEPQQIRKYVEGADCVVFAGGPLIDLPKQLVRHLYTVSLARSLGKPFLAEGIGPGPFVRYASKLTARRLMKLASRITLRAADAVDHAAIRGLPFEVGRCPAFDYLQTRGAQLTRLPASEPAEISTLLAATEGRPVIAVNVRPIGHFYTVGADGKDLQAYTREIEARFERRFADGMKRFAAQSKQPPCFVFFPMNAIQFGMSDLLSAYRIQQHLGADEDVRIWEADASLDGVVELLRRVDVAITMRFHATIFALSQDCKVVGIDYRVGKKDKIAGLMEDVGQPEMCTRIDLLTGDWLADRLQELT